MSQMFACPGEPDFVLYSCSGMTFRSTQSALAGADQGFVEESDENSFVTSIDFPLSIAQQVLGRKRANIQSLRKSTGAKISVTEGTSTVHLIITATSQDQLDKAAIHKIIDIELKGLYQRVESLGYKLSITDEAKDFIATKGYDVQFGARPLKRAIQKYLEDEMAEMIIRATVGEGDLIVVDFDKEEQKIITSIQRQGAIEGSKTPELPEA